MGLIEKGEEEEEEDLSVGLRVGAGLEVSTLVYDISGFVSWWRCSWE